jgi:hypothetical protein
MTQKPGPPDLLDDEDIFRALIIQFLQSPMNYGHDIPRGVGPIALATGIDVQRAIAKVRTFYRMHMTLQ